MSQLDNNLSVSVYMKGNVNNHEFEYDGIGGGDPNSGQFSLKTKLRGGKPLPFSYDIITMGFQYGFRAFTKYPEGIADYFKGSFPEAFQWNRRIEFEDGGVINMSSDITYKDKVLHGDVWALGVNFPPNGPVMKNEIVMEEPAEETLTAKNGVLVGFCPKAYLLKDGSYYYGHMTTFYRSKKSGQPLPGFHFIKHRLVKTKVEPGFKMVEQAEYATAHVCDLPKPN
uniref:Green fluorescent protein FP512 n=1 Tax=Cerianthus membranaceus TaxID=208460 RepID=Q5ZQQ5_CERMM|nr:green fluorescent protein FP512 [Cerianthus membranaceus]